MGTRSGIAGHDPRRPVEDIVAFWTAPGTVIHFQGPLRFLGEGKRVVAADDCPSEGCQHRGRPRLESRRAVTQELPRLVPRVLHRVRGVPFLPVWPGPRPPPAVGDLGQMTVGAGLLEGRDHVLAGGPRTALGITVREKWDLGVGSHGAALKPVRLATGDVISRVREEGRAPRYHFGGLESRVAFVVLLALPTVVVGFDRA
mmetsp:Transcript_11868/g.27823  ORF Transcript_11868/g.27823 Transcript_11868/m.27823 type:complete len:201 (+) Transcript_11868:177-779(+)